MVRGHSLCIGPVWFWMVQLCIHLLWLCLWSQSGMFVTVFGKCFTSFPSVSWYKKHWVDEHLLIISFFFTDMNCSTLTDPSNGQVSYTAGTTFRQTATYSCNAGYNLVGDSTRICHTTGRWSGSAPTCQGMLLLGFEYISSESTSQGTESQYDIVFRLDTHCFLWPCNLSSWM